MSTDLIIPQTVKEMVTAYQQAEKDIRIAAVTPRCFFLEKPDR